MVATASATQDIVVDAFRVESLDESEQAAGMASYVAGYRVGMLVSTAGALFLVSGFQTLGFDHHAAWSAGYFAMAALVLIGVVDDACCRRAAEIGQGGSGARARERAAAVSTTPPSAHSRNSFRATLAFVALVFVVLFKFTDALSGAMTAPFVIDLGFSRNEYAAIIKGVGLRGDVARRLCRRLPGARALRFRPACCIGGVLQGLANLGFPGRPCWVTTSTG